MTFWRRAIVGPPNRSKLPNVWGRVVHIVAKRPRQRRDWSKWFVQMVHIMKSSTNWWENAAAQKIAKKLYASINQPTSKNQINQLINWTWSSSSTSSPSFIELIIISTTPYHLIFTIAICLYKSLQWLWQQNFIILIRHYNWQAAAIN